MYFESFSKPNFAKSKEGTSTPLTLNELFNKSLIASLGQDETKVLVGSEASKLT